MSASKSKVIIWPKDSVATRVMQQLFNEIKHGSKRHRNWLERKCIDFVPLIHSVMKGYGMACVKQDRSRREQP